MMPLRLTLSRKPSLVLKVKQNNRRYYRDDNCGREYRKRGSIFDRIDSLMNDTRQYRARCESLAKRANEIQIGKMDPSWLVFGDTNESNMENDSCMVIEDNDTCMEYDDEEVGQFLFDTFAPEEPFCITNEEVVAFLNDVFEFR